MGIFVLIVLLSIEKTTRRKSKNWRLVDYFERKQKEQNYFESVGSIMQKVGWGA